MSKNNNPKLAAAKREAVKGTVHVKAQETRVFSDDVLKHFIREEYWLKRVKKLLRVRADNQKLISYLSLSAETAYDVRLLKREGLINLLQERPVPFVYCESDKASFEIMKQHWQAPCTGFFGSIESIATDALNENFGAFWGAFPFDVINLDFWGDIHKASLDYRNIFQAIQAIVFQQSHLKKPYELWVTWRADEERAELAVKKAYKDLVNHNIDKSPRFGELFKKRYPQSKPKDLQFEELTYLALLKWLLFIVKSAYSVVQEPVVLKYTRKSPTDSRRYTLYNLLLRIKPYEQDLIPSPASAAADVADEGYESGMELCFKDPIDVDAAFRALSKPEKKRIEMSLAALKREYEEQKAKEPYTFVEFKKS